MNTIKVEVPTEPEGKPKVITFRRILLSKCQQEFEKDKRDDEERENMLNAIKETEDVSTKIFRLKVFTDWSTATDFSSKVHVFLFIADIHVWYCGWKIDVV